MNKSVYGRGKETYIIPAQTSVSTTPIVSTIVKTILDMDMVGLVLCAGPGTGGTLDGAWKVEVSNDFTETSAGGTPYGQVPNASTAKWKDITASTVWTLSGDAIAAVAHGTAASQVQFIQAILCCRAIRVTFTPSAGADTVSAALVAKSRS